MPPADNHPEEEYLATSSRARPWLTVLAMVVVLLGLAVTLVRPGARWYIRRSLSPAQIAQLDELQTKPVNFPREWSEPQPIPPQVTAAIDDWLNVWTTGAYENRPMMGYNPAMEAAFSRAIRRAPLSADAQSSMSAEAASALPLALVTSKLANTPSWDQEYGQGTPLASHGLRVGGKALHLVAAEMLRLGDIEAATTLTVASMKLLRRHPTYLTWSRSVDNDMLHVALSCASATSSVVHLRALLDTLDPNSASMVNTTTVPDWILTPIPRLRHMRRSGHDVSFPPGMSAYDYLRLDLLESPKFVQTEMQNFPAGPRRTELEAFARYHYFMLNASEDVVRVYVYFAPEWLLKTFPTPLTAFKYTYVQCLYDLTRLKLLLRLDEVEKGIVHHERPTDEKYNSLRDHYSGKPYLWHTATRQFYSVGDDKRDHNMREYYTEPQSGVSAVDTDLAVPLPAAEETTDTIGGINVPI